MWSIHTGEHYSATKKNEVRTHATMQRGLENITPSERRQTQKPHILWFHLYQVSRIGKFVEAESRLEVAKCWGGSWEWGLNTSGYGGSFGMTECAGIRQW